MAVSIDEIKRLKALTGIGLTDAKAALVEADGDFDKALESLRKKGLTKAEKKGEREARQGIVDSYVHSERIGVILEVNCETDFVARLPEFKEFAHQIAMQIAAMSPKYQKICSKILLKECLKNILLKNVSLSSRILRIQIKK